MNDCTRRDDLVAAIRAGQWPQGSPADLRTHVAECAHCTEEVFVLSAFAVARESTMRMAPPQSPTLLWWRAQLRMRREAMERLERPGLAISTVTITASILLLLSALAALWKHVEWSRLIPSFSFAGWNAWVLVLVALALSSFAVVALAVGLGTDKRG